MPEWFDRFYNELLYIKNQIEYIHRKRRVLTREIAIKMVNDMRALLDRAEKSIDG